MNGSSNTNSEWAADRAWRAGIFQPTLETECEVAPAAPVKQRELRAAGGGRDARGGQSPFFALRGAGAGAAIFQVCFLALLFVLLTTGGWAGARPDPELMRQYNSVWRLLSDKKMEQAREIARAMLTKDPTFYRAYEILTESYRLEKRLGEIERELQTALLARPRDPYVHYGLALVYRAGSKSNRRRAEARACIAGAPQLAACYYQLFADESVATDIAFVRAIAQRHPDLAAPWYGLAFARRPGARSGIRPAESLAPALKAIERARAVDDLEAEAAAAISAGDVLLWLGKREESNGYRQRALALFERLDDQPQVVSALNGVAYGYQRAGEEDQAEGPYRRALAITRQLGLKGIEAGQWSYLGWFLGETGRLEEAADVFRHEIRVRRDQSDLASEASASNRLGEVLRQLGRYEEAMDQFREAYRLGLEARNRSNAAFAAREIGSTYSAEGDYVRALQHHWEALRLFNKDKDRYRAGAELGIIGGIYLRLGDYARARQYYEHSLSTAREFNDVGEQRRLLGSIGRLLVETGKHAEAALYLEEALALFPRAPYIPVQISELTDLARAQIGMRRYRSAAGSLERGLILARGHRLKAQEGTLLASLGDCRLRQGDASSAERAFDEALSIAEDMRMPELNWTARKGLAQAAESRGDLVGALGQYRSAVEVVESIRSRLSVSELKASFLAGRLEVYDRAIDLLGRLEAQQAGRGAQRGQFAFGDGGNGYSNEAFSLSEKRRARAFLDALSESEAGVPASLPPEEAANYRQLLARNSRAAAALLRDASPRNRKALSGVQQEMEAFWIKFRESNPKYAEPYDVPNWTIARVQQELLRPGDGLIEYSVGEDRSHAWFITQNSLTHVLLPARREIERLVNQYRRAIAQPPSRRSAQTQQAFLGAQGLAMRASAQAQSTALYRMLFRGVDDALSGCRRLIVAPDGILYYLPFETLVSPAETRARRAPQYLLEKLNIVYAPSASVLAALQNGRKAAPGRKELLAFGDPISPFGVGAAKQPDAALVRSLYAGRGLQFVPLPSTRTEVSNIASLYPTEARKTYLGAAATESALKRERLSDYARLHFATHAFADERTPALSGLLLAAGGGEDGVLQLNEILALHLDADLVVLSGCQTGLGRFVNGEGMIGIASAFLQAGAAQLAVSLWQVNDISTAEFMAVFYRELKDGRSPDEALRQAKLHMLHSASPAYHHPYFWAPFVMIGTSRRR